MRNGFIDLVKAHIEAKRQASRMRKSAYLRRQLSDYIASNVMPKGKILYDISQTLVNVLVNQLAKEITKRTTGIDYDKIMEDAGREFESKKVGK